MLNRKVIATQITNLTDARYFAARGIDYLLFDLDKISLQQILEIKEWVEGPEMLLLLSSSSLPLLDEAIIKVKPVAIAGREESILQDIKHLEGHVQIFDWISDKKIVMELQDYILIANESELGHLRADDGVMISGGSEQAVGMKAFDQLDSVLDRLEN